MLLSLLELAGNKALEYDAESQQRLEKLQGKTMTLRLKTLNQAVTLNPTQQGLEFASGDAESADVTLSATLGAMIKISRDGYENAELKTGELEMSGDPIIGQRFAQVIADLNIDWESLLSEQIGEAPARTISMVANQTKEFAQESRGKLHDFVNHLIKEELSLVADKNEVDQFLDDVDSLRASVDRLAVKLKRLQTQISSNNSHSAS